MKFVGLLIKALKQARKLPKTEGSRIYDKVQQLIDFPACQENLDVKALKNHTFDYRLRVGRYRILFNFNEEIHIVSIEEVKKRDEHTY